MSKITRGISGATALESEALIRVDDYIDQACCVVHFPNMNDCE